jgi:hypothetical protein
MNSPSEFAESLRAHFSLAGSVSMEQCERLWRHFELLVRWNAEGRRIPRVFSYRGIPGLSREIRETLERVRPVTLGHALRIPGVTPAAIAVLDVYLSLTSSLELA